MSTEGHYFDALGRGLINSLAPGGQGKVGGISYVFPITPIQISKLQTGDKARVEGEISTSFLLMTPLPWRGKTVSFNIKKCCRFF